jgi:hypothetical protein
LIAACFPHMDTMSELPELAKTAGSWLQVVLFSTSQDFEKTWAVLDLNQ